MAANSPQFTTKDDHLLLIRFSAMGDVAMLVPVLRILTQQYPDLHITILTRGFFAPIFENIPGVNVYPADLKGKHKGVTGLFKLAQEIKTFGITVIGDMHNVLRSKMLKIFLLGSGIKFSQIDKGRAEKKALTTSKNKVFIQLKTTHRRYADVLAELGYPIDLNTPVNPEKYVLSYKIKETTGEKDGRWVGFAPFAAHAAKAYPLNLVSKVINELSQQDKIKIFLFGGGQEEIIKLESLAAGYNNVVSLAGKLKFEEELRVISNLDLMVSMDSGNAHLAAMYGVKVLTLWGVTHPFAGFGAFHQPHEHNLLPDLSKYPAIPTSIYGNNYPEGYENVMETIRPDVVIKTINKILSENSENKNG